ncbi:MAG: hypothetical protein KatS3mg092_0625 [Patescibacteria group bacterium]|nr:MAG: hypothetical protein KatS3mg092_0625 [Patescibacteria group bacterium]
MANTITLTQSSYKELLNRLSRLEKMVATLLEKFEKEPTYGSDEWWYYSIKKGEEDIKKGNYKVFDSSKDLKKYLKSKI